MPQLGEQLIVGHEGPVVMISGRVAANLERRFRLDELRQGTHDPELKQALTAMHHVALTWVGSAGGTTLGKTAEPVSGLNNELTSAEAATAAGVSPRAIRRAIHEDRLSATLVNGIWRISPADLQRYVAARSHGS